MLVINFYWYSLCQNVILPDQHTSQIGLRIQYSRPDHVILHVCGNDLDFV